MIHNLAQYSAKKPSSPPLIPRIPATTLQNSSCPPAFDSHPPNLIAAKISAALPSCRPSFFCSWLFAAGTLGKSDLSFCDSRKGNSMHCNVKTSHHSQQGDSRDVDESLGVNTQSPPTHLLVAQALLESYLLYGKWLCLDYAFRPLGLYHFHCCF